MGLIANGDGSIAKTIEVKIVKIDASTIEVRIPDRRSDKLDALVTMKFKQATTEDVGALFARAKVWISCRLRQIDEEIKARAVAIPDVTIVMFAEDGTCIADVT